MVCTGLGTQQLLNNCVYLSSIVEIEGYSGLKTKKAFKRVSGKGQEPTFVKHLLHASHDARHIIYIVIFNPQFTDEKTEVQ